MMPIRPQNRGRYPDNWPEISRRIRFDRAGGHCECRGECGRPATHLLADGRCGARHGDSIYQSTIGAPVRQTIVLTTAHLDHTPENCDDDNLRAMCQGCHLHYDRQHHAETRNATRAAELAATMDPLWKD
jgi:hypothetical protein